jgi:purine-cytosine permease-like protein
MVMGVCVGNDVWRIFGFSTTFTPSLSVAWLSALLRYLISIALLILITARLANRIADFYGTFFTILSLIMSLNAAINLADYFQALPSFSSFSDPRLTPDFGVVQYIIRQLRR